MGVYDEVRSYRKRLTEYVDTLYARSNAQKRRDYAEFRGFDLKVVEECGVFYIGNMAEMLIPQYLDSISEYGVVSPTNNRIIYEHRWVIPFRDMEGLVMGMTGYTPTENERYMYATPRYYMRTGSLWGQERLAECIDKGIVVVTEGITDAMRVMSLGIHNVVSTAGSHKSLHEMLVLNRVKGVVFLPHRDRAGDKTKEYWITDNYIRLSIPHTYNDVDDFAKESTENAEYIKEAIDICSERLLHTKFSNESIQV